MVSSLWIYCNNSAVQVDGASCAALWLRFVDLSLLSNAGVLKLDVKVNIRVLIFSQHHYFLFLNTQKNGR